MVPREFRKSLCIIAGLITLLEAVIWGTASVFIIGVYNCNWDFINVDRGVSILSMIYITYFMGGCRGSDFALRLKYSFSPPANAATSLQVWLWTNAILSAIWIPTCFLLIVAVSAEVKGKNGALLYYPWQALTIVLIVFDFAGAIYHASDIFQTMNPDNYAKFTSATSWENLTVQSSSEGVITWLPSLLVTLFFCRFLIIWIINITFFLAVIKAGHAVSCYKTKNLQMSQQNSEEIKSWRDMFYNSTDPICPENIQTHSGDDQLRNMDYILQQSHQARINIHLAKQESPHSVHKIDKSGNLTEEFSKTNQRSNFFNSNKDNQPRSSPYRQRRNIGYTSRPVTPDSFNDHWHDIPPPITGEITVPPELSRVRPFSYTAGDQPQLMKANLSRSNSRTEQPHIPHPDYTIAERRAASLEYIPNRFKVPNPKRTTHQAFNYDKHLPSIQKTPQFHHRPLPTTAEVGFIPRSKYNPGTTNMRQTSNEYNINKLY